MISDFRFINSNLEIPVDLEYPLDIEKNITKDELLKFTNFRGKSSISWRFQHRTITISDPHVSVKGFPDTSLRFVVAVYSEFNQHYPAPNNAVIYHADGSVHKQLNMPTLQSKNIVKSLDYSAKQSSPSSKNDMRFEGFAWRKNSSENLVNVISILYKEEWWESRVLIPHLGEITDLVDEGRL